MNHDKPTNVRYLVVAVTAFAALWMYIDRVCFSTLSPGIGDELGIDGDDMSYVLGAFFLSYALLQVPMGSLADRYGPRLVLTVSIIAWSLCTAATSVVAGAITLLTVRLGLGACESGAYPAAASLVRRWATVPERGRLSSAVTFGGRIGGALAPFITTLAAINLLGDPATRTENWRGVFLLYGALGIVSAILFWVVVRDTPAAHPWANAAEAERVPPAPIVRDSTTWRTRLAALAGSRNMWLFGGLQFFVNVGWAFLITSLPKYLKDRFQIEGNEVGRMQTVVLTIGCLGMAMGGFFADGMYRLLGSRWGRAIPLGLTMTTCAFTYVLATQLRSPWPVVVVLGVMAFLVDVSNPVIWAFAQDVGGRHVGAALGWGNMLGNLGAVASPVVLRLLVKAHGWDVAFFVFASGFVLAGLCGLALNALTPVTRPDPPPDPELVDYGEPEGA